MKIADSVFEKIKPLFVSATSVDTLASDITGNNNTDAKSIDLTNPIFKPLKNSLYWQYKHI